MSDRKSITIFVVVLASLNGLLKSSYVRAKMLIYLCFFVYNALQLLEALAEHIDMDIWEGKNKAISRAYKYIYIYRYIYIDTDIDIDTDINTDIDMREDKKYLFAFISWY